MVDERWRWVVVNVNKPEERNRDVTMAGKFKTLIILIIDVFGVPVPKILYVHFLNYIILTRGGLTR